MKSKISKIITYIFKKLLLIFLISLCTLFLFEFALKLKGFDFPESRPVRKKPLIESDKTLGWKMIPGTYTLPPNSASTDSIHVSITSERSRRTSPDQIDSKDEILFIGGSFTYGWGLSDDEHVAWKVQTNLPQYNVQNLAVGAYGTYQSLLVLENEFNRGKRPQHVIYGYIRHHKLRNVAEGNWAMLMHDVKGSNHIQVPYVTLNEMGELERQEPFRVNKIPLAGDLVSIFTLQRLFLNYTSRKRVNNAETILIKLLLEMKNLCEQQGTEFYVAILDENQSKMSQFTTLLKQNGIQYIDCNVPLTEFNTIKEDGHPIEAVHEEWSERITDALSQSSVYTNESHKKD